MTCFANRHRIRIWSYYGESVNIIQVPFGYSAPVEGGKRMSTLNQEMRIQLERRMIYKKHVAIAMNAFTPRNSEALVCGQAWEDLGKK